MWVLMTLSDIERRNARCQISCVVFYDVVDRIKCDYVKVDNLNSRLLEPTHINMPPVTFY